MILDWANQSSIDRSYKYVLERPSFAYAAIWLKSNWMSII